MTSVIRYVTVLLFETPYLSLMCFSPKRRVSYSAMEPPRVRMKLESPISAKQTKYEAATLQQILLENSKSYLTLVRVPSLLRLY